MRPPSSGTWRDGYGTRINPKTGRSETHHGLDIGPGKGDDRTLVAPEAGKVIGYGSLTAWPLHGLVLRMRGDDGIEHWLAHTDRPLVSVGARVAEGTPVAVMGMTGQTSGLHVHWETRRDGTRFDPATWLTRPADTGNRKDIMATLDNDDKNWLREMVRQELGGAFDVHGGLTPGDKDWSREMVRQELGGALHS